MAPSAINATVKPSMKLNNTTSRQVISNMRVTIVPNMAVRGVGSAKYNVVNVNAQNASRSANIVAMSASSYNDVEAHTARRLATSVPDYNEIETCTRSCFG